VAGINAALRAKGDQPFTLGRDEAYIGVMIDDLVTKGTNEPYRLLTSRAEYRLILRHDNADLRLTEKGYQLGLISEDRHQHFLAKKAAIAAELQRLDAYRIKPKQPGVAELLAAKEMALLQDGLLASEFLKRPQISYADLMTIMPSAEPALDRYSAEQVEIQTKYAGYINKE